MENPYPLENLRNMGQSYIVRLQTINRDSFAHFKEVKYTYRKFKMLQKSNKRGLAEVTDLLNAWQAFAEYGNKTATHINDMKTNLSKRYADLNSKKDEILTHYREGIAMLKRLELHKALWKDPATKQYLIDIYYNEKSMDSFKSSCEAQLKNFVKILEQRQTPIQVPKVQDISTRGLHATAENLKSEAQLVAGGTDPDQLITSCLDQVYQECRSFHKFFETLKSAYVIDNTKLIEMESTTHSLKDLCRTADKQLCLLQSFDLKVRSLKESVAKEIMHLRRQITYRFASKEVR